MNNSFTEYRIAASQFLSLSTMSRPPSGLLCFCWEVSYKSLGLPYKWWVVFLCLVSRFSPHLSLWTLTPQCVCLCGLYELFLLGVCWASWVCTLFFNKFQKSSAIMSLSIFFSSPFSLSSYCGTPITYVLLCLMVLHISLRLCSFFFIFFYLFLGLHKSSFWLDNFF